MIPPGCVLLQMFYNLIFKKGSCNATGLSNICISYRIK